MHDDGDEGVELVSIAGKRGLGAAGRDGLGRGGGSGVGRLLVRGRLVLASPLGGVDLRIEGRGGGLRHGWEEAAVRNEAFDGYDHGERRLDLTGNAAPGR
jgi:hypothetical protein